MLTETTFRIKWFSQLQEESDKKQEADETSNKPKKPFRLLKLALRDPSNRPTKNADEHHFVLPRSSSGSGTVARRLEHSHFVRPRKVDRSGESLGTIPLCRTPIGELGSDFRRPTFALQCVPWKAESRARGLHSGAGSGAAGAVRRRTRFHLTGDAQECALRLRLADAALFTTSFAVVHDRSGASGLLLPYYSKSPGRRKSGVHLPGVLGKGEAELSHLQ